jgi:four helix bundle protein
MPFSFEALDVYQKAVDFSVSILGMTKRFGDGNHTLAQELGKTAVSVSSDIAHGGGVWAKDEKKSRFISAQCSCFRCAALLSVGAKLGLVKEPDLTRMNEHIETLAKMLSKLAQSVDKERSRVEQP